MKSIIKLSPSYKKYVLATLANDRYIDQAKQLFSSAYFQGGWVHDFILLGQNISKKNREWFTNKGIYVYDCKPLWPRNIGSYNLSSTALSKFYLFKPFFKKWEKIIFLDADILVKSLLEDLTKVTHFAAVPDCIKITNILLKYWCTNVGYQFFNRNNNLKLFKELENTIDLTADSFNTGVMVIPTKSIQEDTFHKLKLLFNKYKNIAATGDQTILNLYFYKNWKRLSYIYNSSVHSLPYYYGFDAGKMQTAVLHFLGNNVKPWNKKSIFYTEWKSNLKRAEIINTQTLEIFPKTTKISVTQELIFGFYLGLRGTLLLNYYFSLVSLLRNIKHYFLLTLLKLLTLNFTKLYSINRKNKILANVYISTSPDQIFNTIWTMLSLNYYLSGLHFVVIPEEPLNNKSLRIFSKINLNLEVINDQRIEEYLKHISKYKVFHYFALGGKGGKKLLVSLLHPGVGKTILIDSNLLFFKAPYDLQRWLMNKNEECLYLQSSDNKLILSSLEMEVLLGKKPTIKYFSSHLLCLSDSEYKKKFTFSQINNYLSKMADILSDRQILDNVEEIDSLRYSKHIEPTIYSLMLENCKLSMLPRSYSDNDMTFSKENPQSQRLPQTAHYFRNTHLLNNMLLQSYVYKIMKKNSNLTRWLI